ncbi:uncharacterized protein LOC104893775 isoform X2 [Beta vulgaris subsp. vulgaris]|uniref:uncharacterized protein LOC104893775 isoform X2 n=1 Tax=Beta vulgaris subsp. vulgaris TaxID=3555 RepID=UPI00203711F7|nr:uncharacterized protein LOC104893775 isoform X2 [Beta vulgaris subsp. vulgaris]
MRCQALTFPGVPSLSSHHPLITCTWNPSSHNIPISGLGLIILNVPKAKRGQRYWLIPRAYRSTLKFEEDEEESSHGSSSESDQLSRFEEAVKLFNEREYYACHDLLESLWFDSYDPRRTLFHALLQCAVGFYHLFNQNHKGAMMEMGEGLCKLRKLNFERGPFHQFEQEITTVLNFIYQTQLELAACNEDFCLTMEQTERSYQLLEGYGAGQCLYVLEESDNGYNNDKSYLVFDPKKSYSATNLPPTRVKLPILEATQNHLMAFENC